jgi:hypothetical protein
VEFACVLEGQQESLLVTVSAARCSSASKQCIETLILITQHQVVECPQISLASGLDQIAFIHPSVSRPLFRD